MARDTKRKFIVNDDSWRSERHEARRIRQGYLPVQGAIQVRVCIEENESTLAIRSSGAGLERSDFQYPIPFQDAEDLIQGFCIDPLIVKIRHRVQVKGETWEIDEYKGANEGLLIATVEMQSPEDRFHHPAWLGEEVTNDARFGDENLVRLPYSQWTKQKA